MDDSNDINYFIKPLIQDIKEELLYDISVKFEKNGCYVESLNYQNPELNQIYSQQYKQKAPFAENVEEERIFINKSNRAEVIHKIIDLHGFSRLSAAQALRRIFNYSDRSRINIIKIMVGRGLHSKRGQVLPKVVRDVANELDLPEPIQHRKNEGFLVMILPAKNDIDETK